MTSPNPFPPQRRPGPGCWAIGSVSCTVVIVLTMILFFVAYEQFSKTPAGRDLRRQFGATIQGAKKAIDCEQHLSDVHAAMERYIAKNGAYPPSVNALVPDYLPNPGECHCELDSNPDPKHVTFTYTPPSPPVKPSAEVLSFTWTQKMQVENVSQTMVSRYYYTADGKEMVQQSSIDSQGHTTVAPARERSAGDHS